jgi:hypothetical protein
MKKKNNSSGKAAQSRVPKAFGIAQRDINIEKIKNEFEINELEKNSQKKSKYLG